MSMGHRIPIEEHSGQDWAISEIAHDFDLIDAWSLPASGQREEFSALPAILLSPGSHASDRDNTAKISSLLFAARSGVGRVLGWDDDPNTLPIPGCTETSLQDRLPDKHWTPSPAGALPPSSSEPDPGRKGPAFRPIFQTETEFAAELSNRTLHAVLHLAWLEQGPDRYQGQLGVYVKHRGRFGRYYMTAIAPFRHHIVYPAMMKQVAVDWQVCQSEIGSQD